MEGIRGGFSSVLVWGDAERAGLEVRRARSLLPGPTLKRCRVLSEAVFEIVRCSHFSQSLAEPLRMSSFDPDFLPVAPVVGWVMKAEHPGNRTGAGFRELAHSLVDEFHKLVA
jgi:hypothetical protein